jgi:hypothetical protein
VIESSHSRLHNSFSASLGEGIKTLTAEVGASTFNPILFQVTNQASQNSIGAGYFDALRQDATQ